MLSVKFSKKFISVEIFNETRLYAFSEIFV